MAHTRDALRYPAKRVLLQRTRLAYVHLRNLLTDAKRDRSARVYGYVAVWLPEELITLFLEEGEVVNATSSADGERFVPIAIADAIHRVPTAAEYGSICFHEATDELLDMMFHTQTGLYSPWPQELKLTDTEALLGFLYATMHDGAIEIRADGYVHYVIISSGSPVRGYFSDNRPGDPIPHVKALLAPMGTRKGPQVRLWTRAEALPAQASPALILAYRELVAALIAKLEASGQAGAAEVVESVRRTHAPKHHLLEKFSPSLPSVRDPVTDTPQLTKALGAWVTDSLMLATATDLEPETVIKELTAARKHMFQAAGFYDALPWKLSW